MKYDIHIHTNYSDGANTPPDVIRRAKKIGLSGIAITDHDTVEGCLNAKKYNSKNFKIIPGVEITSAQGHILCLDAALGIDSFKPAEEVIEKIHDAGGIAIAAHPYDMTRGGVGDLIYKLNFDGIEVYNGRLILSRKSIKDIEKIADALGITKTGGSDAHSLGEIGNVCIDVSEDPVDCIKKGEVKIVFEDPIKRKVAYLRSLFLKRIG